MNFKVSYIFEIKVTFISSLFDDTLYAVKTWVDKNYIFGLSYDGWYFIMKTKDKQIWNIFTNIYIASTHTGLTRLKLFLRSNYNNNFICFWFYNLKRILEKFYYIYIVNIFKIMIKNLNICSLNIYNKQYIFCNCKN